MPLSLNLKIGRRAGSDVVGLDVQPGLVAAVQARVNGAILAERAAAAALPADAMREGDVMDPAAVTEALRELFAGSRLGKRVRVGVANQRTVMRTLELPPVSDAKELAAAVQFQAQDQIPMPLASAVMDFHALGVVDTPAGPRQKVVVVAAQRDMIERLLAVVRGAGLTPVGIDLSAFAMIRSLHRSTPDQTGRVLYLNVDGLTNVAIAEGTVCRFTRVVGGGFEEMAVQLAERRGIPLVDARALLASVDLRTPAPDEAPATAPHAPYAGEAAQTEVVSPELPGGAAADNVVLREQTVGPAGGQDAAVASASAGLASEQASFGEMPGGPTPEAASATPPVMPGGEVPPAPAQVQPAPAPGTEPAPAPGGESASTSSDTRLVLENGVRAISGEVRNSLDFHRSQEGGGDVARVVLSGFALDLPGFAEALQAALGVEVRPAAVALADASLTGHVSTNRLAVAAGLAAAEAPQ
jgi:type IV pilus assembly protein PilM